MDSLYDNPGAISAADVNNALCALSDDTFTRISRIGTSVCGRSLLALELGAMRSPVLFVGGTHGMEWASVLVTLRLAEIVAHAAAQKRELHGIDVYTALQQRGVIFVPLLNPDGYELRRSGRGAVLKRAHFLSQFEDYDLQFWQSNANGVDINHNFNAGFCKARKIVREADITGPAPTRYGGPFPFSEPETRAVRTLCRRFLPRSLFALHSQGEEMYWRYGDKKPEGSEYIANLLASLTGYALCEPDAIASHAGMKDWFIKKYNRPGFTIELGLGKNPLPYADFAAIWERVERALLVAMIL